jgi:pimeloyl-ACP methyl ester carboxylesterase
MELLPAVQSVLRRSLIARGVQSKTVPIGAQLLHYYELTGAGAGPPVVLVHGLGGSANGFSQVIFRLRRRFSRIFAPDLPGHGFSRSPPDAPLGLAAQLAALAGFCEKAVSAPAFVVGNSLGGALCVGLVSRYPRHVRALGLIAPAGAPMKSAQWAELTQSLTPRSSADVRALTRKLFHRAPLLALIFAPQLRELYGTRVIQEVFGDSNASHPLAPEVLRQLAIPTLLLWGASEKLLPYDGIDYFRAHLPPSSRVHVVEGVGHVPQLERPALVANYLIQFADDSGL